MVLSPIRNPVFDGFRAQLRKLGYVEGRDLRLDFRTADGDVDRLSSLAQNWCATAPTRSSPRAQRRQSPHGAQPGRFCLARPRLWQTRPARRIGHHSL
jgi:hypothetical protein